MRIIPIMPIESMAPLKTVNGKTFVQRCPNRSTKAPKPAPLVPNSKKIFDFPCVYQKKVVPLQRIWINRQISLAPAA